MVISCASMMRQRALVGVFLWGPYRGVDLQRIGAIGSCATVSRGLDETHFTWLVVGGNAATVDIHGLHDCQATLWREVAHDLGSAALPYTDRRGSDLDLVAHKGGRFAAMLQSESIGENPAAERQR